MQKETEAGAPELLTRLRAFAQLVRLPNVFTAWADIGLAWCAAVATGTPPSRWPGFLFLMACSGCLYSAGMVWNDFFDIEQDRRERPLRPLPSGRISRRAAGLFGTALFCAGLGFAVWAGLLTGTSAPPILAGVLVLAILLYDAWLKRIWLGPVAMAACRFLNVLLGLSIAEPTLPWSARLGLALIVGIYIVGVTWFARTEARTSRQSSLTAGATIMLLALVLALTIPAWLDTGLTSVFFPYLLLAMGFWVGIPACRAIASPTPIFVQTTVKRAVLGLVILDAALASALAGAAGLAIFALLLPALYLGRWIYST